MKNNQFNHFCQSYVEDATVDLTVSKYEIRHFIAILPISDVERRCAERTVSQVEGPAVRTARFLLKDALSLVSAATRMPIGILLTC